MPRSGRSRVWRLGVTAVVLAATCLPFARGTEAIRVATLNVQNYLCMDRRIDGRFLPGHPKPEAEKTALRAVIRAVQPDVLCLQEMGAQPFLDELQQDLAREGIDYPHAVLLKAADPLRHIAVLSRVPLVSAIHHTDLNFEYLGRREAVKRGMLEVSVGSAEFSWRIFIVHLKSPLTEDAADPTSQIRRVGEARAVRDRILQRTGSEAGPRFLVVGDLNDAPDSRTLAGLMRRGERTVVRLVPAHDSRGETWTHRSAGSDRYERVDYILASADLQPWIVGGAAAIFDGPGSNDGSDHRLVWVDIAPPLASPTNP